MVVVKPTRISKMTVIVSFEIFETFIRPLLRHHNMPDFAGPLPNVLSHIPVLMIDRLWDCNTARYWSDCRGPSGASGGPTLIEHLLMQSSKQLPLGTVTLMLPKVSYQLNADSL